MGLWNKLKKLNKEYEEDMERVNRVLKPDYDSLSAESAKSMAVSKATDCANDWFERSLCSIYSAAQNGQFHTFVRVPQEWEDASFTTMSSAADEVKNRLETRGFKVRIDLSMFTIEVGWN